jgi:hypothetical protein
MDEPPAEETLTVETPQAQPGDVAADEKIDEPTGEIAAA